MNETLSTFMKIGITALCIGLLLFGVAYSMLDKEAGEYEQKIEAERVNLP
ncbi:hypothetical protein NC797_07270 [Aquibacillus sp. 3ASR75-11]|uniref:Uncharacterized protein n=1 Tax=Terrihalobacillus insolitus TaxID=2950438 RepID=A0A9X3WTE1_9BACI|nr:hypothetical protein [Terrihalobacillus insolitus]MDC3424308.1 hypothetical protein [Terrihalobacillus insolitus]